MSRIYIVAEIGCNHNGDFELAKKMVKEAKSAGVDAVKFQTFKAEQLISKYAPKAEYQIKVTGNEETQLEMTRKLELPYDEFIKLEEYAKNLGWMSSQHHLILIQSIFLHPEIKKFGRFHQANY